jgi:hypothetical protein
MTMKQDGRRQRQRWKINATFECSAPLLHHEDDKLEIEGSEALNGGVMKSCGEQ